MFTNNKPKMVHKYFDHKSSEWNILEFLNECEVESFDRKIYCYIKDLEDISNYETVEIWLCCNSLLGRTATKHRRLARLSVAQYFDIPPGLRWLARLPDVQRLIADLVGWLMKEISDKSVKNIANQLNLSF
ncbi:19352_t:CDS:2 [Funneliformis geosporum]|nr:19352_t:CDS:2 [Funneliformis geosporum]